jgi:hypothetical protein
MISFAVAICLRVGGLAPPRGDARFGMRQSEIPEIASRRGDVGYFHSSVVSAKVPLGGAIEIARIETQSRDLIGHIADIREIVRLAVEIERSSLQLFGIAAITESVSDGHRALRQRSLQRRAGRLAAEK